MFISYSKADVVMTFVCDSNNCVSISALYRSICVKLFAVKQALFRFFIVQCINLMSVRKFNLYHAYANQSIKIHGNH